MWICSQDFKCDVFAVIYNNLNNFKNFMINSHIFIKNNNNMKLILHAKILEFLNTQDIAELYSVNKATSDYLKQIKAIKSSI